MSSSPKHQQQPAGALNPTMVYRPLTPPAPGGDYLRIDESDDPKFRLRVRVAWIARVVLSSLTLSSIITFIARGRLDRTGFVVPLFVMLWFVFIWHSFQVVRPVWGGRKLRFLPRISVTVGDAGCVLGGEGDGDEGRERYAGAVGRFLGAFVDLALGVVVITFGSLADRSTWRWGNASKAGIVLAVISGTLMVIVSVLSVFKVFHTMAIDFSFYANGDSQPITLGRPQADVDSRRDPISISA